MIETDRTIVGLLWHENIMNVINNAKGKGFSVSEQFLAIYALPIT